YSFKLKKAGFRTQVCIDMNGMVLFTSNYIHEADCVGLDGGYAKFIKQVVAKNENLHAKNF
ncbi:hypothetical protein K439DRAFT_1237676, partial [Ramaria rubella]